MNIQIGFSSGFILNHMLVCLRAHTTGTDTLIYAPKQCFTLIVSNAHNVSVLWEALAGWLKEATDQVSGLPDVMEVSIPLDMSQLIDQEFIWGHIIASLGKLVGC